MNKFLLATLVAGLGCCPASAFSIATWNAAGGTVENVTEKAEDIKLLGAEFRKSAGGLPDVLVLEEVTSYAAARKIADFLGYTDATIITTDVGDDQEIWPFALEIALITTHEIVAVDAFQSLRESNGNKVPPRPPFIEIQKSGTLSKGRATEIVLPDIITAANSEKPSRGILRVELADEHVVYGVHLASSGLSACRAWQTAGEALPLEALAKSFGLDDHATAIKAAREAVLEFQKTIPEEGVPAIVAETIKRAQQREAGAAAVALLAAEDAADDKSVYVAGDFNTPVHEECKTGSQLEQDSEPQLSCKGGEVLKTCGSVDGFDDTIAILSKGLTGGPVFSVLTKDLDRTYVKTGFVNSPIDNVLVSGPASNATHRVTKIIGPKVDNKVFGSDHYAVLAIRP